MAIPLSAAESNSVAQDDDLILRIRAGDEQAFDALVRQYYNGLCIFAARITKSDAVAEELVQDVLLRIWQQHGEWAVSGNLGAYLYVGVRNAALNSARREHLLHRWQERATAGDEHIGVGRMPEADEEVRTAELADAIERAIQELPPRCRQVFVLRRQHHLSCIEVARVMEISPKTVEIQMGIALKALRKKLEHLL
ncbi:MAG: RNA polymerase sigma-70 factor [Gemmatimonadaceae bacterium]